MRLAVHEMRNQLAVAVANIEAFIDGKLAPTQERLGAVLLALTKLDALMTDIRPAAAATAAPAKMRPIDVCALIASEILALEAVAAAAGIELVVDVCSRPQAACQHFTGDPIQVSQIMKNVLLNAIKYTGRGGRITLYCHREPGVLALEISDNGPGVRVAERENIFDGGVRGSAASAAAGNGLGLAVVRSMVAEHGGTVTVADSTGGGACFTIRLPGGVQAAACQGCHEL